MKKDIPFNGSFPDDNMANPAELLILHRAFLELTGGDEYDDEQPNTEKDLEEAGKDID